MHESRELWDETYTTATGPELVEVSTFARTVATTLRAGQRVLELGCGPAADSVFFARQGHQVTATDFSLVVLERNRTRYRDEPRLAFQAVDLHDPLPFLDGAFDVVYARLSLHYFADQTMRQILREVHRVLAADSTLAFMCKSTADPLYGQGVQLERDMFVLTGKARRFFSEAYIRDCLMAGWRIERLWSGPEVVYGQPSAVVRVVATKSDEP